MRFFKYRADSGFTTIELLISLIILGIFVSLAAVGINTLTVTNNRARDLALANMIAQNKVELLRSSGYNSISVGTVDFSSELPSELTSPKNANYVVSAPSDGIKEIVITITFDDYQNTRTVRYKTIVSELGVGQ